MRTPPPIDFFQALQDGLKEVARVEPNSGSTEHLRRPGEHVAPIRTEPVAEVAMSLQELVDARPQPGYIDDDVECDPRAKISRVTMRDLIDQRPGESREDAIERFCKNL